MRYQGWEFFWRDQQLDASGDARLSSDQSNALQGEHHVMDGRWADAEMPLQVGFGGRATEDAGIGVE